MLNSSLRNNTWWWAVLGKSLHSSSCSLSQNNNFPIGLGKYLFPVVPRSRLNPWKIQSYQAKVEIQAYNCIVYLSHCFNTYFGILSSRNALHEWFCTFLVESYCIIEPCYQNKSSIYFSGGTWGHLAELLFL